MLETTVSSAEEEVYDKYSLTETDYLKLYLWKIILFSTSRRKDASH